MYLLVLWLLENSQALNLHSKIVMVHFAIEINPYISVSYLFYQCCVCFFLQEITNLKDAKQLMIQQKLELQGKIDNIHTALDQEKRSQEMIKEQLKKREEELKKKCVEIEAKLVSMSNKETIAVQACLNTLKIL